MTQPKKALLFTNIVEVKEFKTPARTVSFLINGELKSVEVPEKCNTMNELKAVASLTLNADTKG